MTNNHTALIEALEPFAHIAEHISQMSDGNKLWLQDYTGREYRPTDFRDVILVEHIRRARKALADASIVRAEAQPGVADKIARQMRVRKIAVDNLSTQSAQREARLILADYVLENFDAILALTPVQPIGGEDVRERVIELIKVAFEPDETVEKAYQVWKGEHFKYADYWSGVKINNRACELADAILSAAPQSGWRPEVKAFADLMEAQLRKNDHKTGWKSDRPHALLKRLYDEAAELGHAMPYDDDFEPEIVGLEAADVANFAMMIADVCGGLPNPQNSEVSDA